MGLLFPSASTGPGSCHGGDTALCYGVRLLAGCCSQQQKVAALGWICLVLPSCFIYSFFLSLFQNQSRLVVITGKRWYPHGIWQTADLPTLNLGCLYRLCGKNSVYFDILLSNLLHDWGMKPSASRTREKHTHIECLQGIQKFRDRWLTVACHDIWHVCVKRSVLTCYLWCLLGYETKQLPLSIRREMGKETAEVGTLLRFEKLFVSMKCLPCVPIGVHVKHILCCS